MPNFNLSQEEVDAIVTAIMGFVNQSTVAKKQPSQTVNRLFIEEGQKIVKQMNCQGCHKIENEGGTISESVEKWLISYKERPESDAKKVTDSFSPPDLFGVGEKVNPEWLFNFLHSPTEQIRPWISVRMPTFNFNAEHLNALVKYFNALDETEFPFIKKIDSRLTKAEFKDAEKLFSIDYFDCQKCHVVGNQLPSGTEDTWAPNLGLAKTRLNPEWMIEWIKNPSGLVPGTKMPTFFDPADYENSGPPDILDGNEDEQIRILRNYLLNLSNGANKNVVVDVETVPPAKTETNP